MADDSKRHVEEEKIQELFNKKYALIQEKRKEVFDSLIFLEMLIIFYKSRKAKTAEDQKMLREHLYTVNLLKEVSSGKAKYPIDKKKGVTGWILRKVPWIISLWPSSCLEE